MSSSPQPANLAPGPRRPSLTRSQTLRRTMAVKAAMAGNGYAMTHGVRTALVSRPDVQTEIALLFAVEPALDPVRDRRLVELCAMTNIRLVRCDLAMEEHGETAVLTGYRSRLGPLAERLERQLHERAREREAARRAAAADPDAAFRYPRALGGGPV